MQSTERGNELLPGDMGPRNSVVAVDGADPKGSVAVRSSVVSARLLSACAAKAGSGFAGDTLQQEVPWRFTSSLVLIVPKFVIMGQCGPQHSGTLAASPRKLAPKADRPLVRKTKAKIAATSLKCRGM